MSMLVSFPEMLNCIPKKKKMQETPEYVIETVNDLPNLLS